jgi:hypothetical protein
MTFTTQQQKQQQQQQQKLKHRIIKMNFSKNQSNVY